MGGAGHKSLSALSASISFRTVESDWLFSRIECSFAFAFFLCLISAFDGSSIAVARSQTFQMTHGWL